MIDDGELSKLSFWTYAKSRLDGVETRQLERDRSQDAFFRRAGQTASAVSDRERFAQFYADTEPPGGVTTPPSLVQLYMPIGMAFERPAVQTVVGPLKYKPQEIARDISNFKAALTPDVSVQETFMPAVAPGMLASRYRNTYYKSEEELYFAVADALAEEYSAIIAAGFLLQVDECHYPDAIGCSSRATGLQRSGHGRVWQLMRSITHCATFHQKK